jgi:hypothetical protein
MIPHRVELSALHRTGHELPVELGLSVVGTAHGTQLVAVVQDISERKEAETRIRCEVPSVTPAGEAILTMALDRTIESCNPAAEELYGYAASEMSAHRWKCCTSPHYAPAPAPSSIPTSSKRFSANPRLDLAPPSPFRPRALQRQRPERAPSPR